jgi:hypothetical protein
MVTPPRHRRLPLGLVAVLVATSAAIGGGAVALAMSADDTDAAAVMDEASARAHTHPPTSVTSVTSEGSADDPASRGTTALPRAPQHHQHPALAPYAQRYADASATETNPADALLADVRSTLVAYADADAAIAAGYQAPVVPRGPMVHYLNRSAVRDGAALDPSRPEGLVYYMQAGAEPVLLGAFFVARPGTAAPTPAGDLVVWHSHNPSCSGFFATADAPCADVGRMLHVWTVEQATIVPRRTGQPVDVRVTDPFGVPFGASVERVK